MKRAVGISLKRALKGAIQGIFYVIKQPRWALLAIILTFIISLVVYLSINIGFYGALLTSGLPIDDKFAVVGMMAVSMFGSYNDDLNGWLLLIVSVLQAVTLTALVFSIKQNRRIDLKVAGQSGLALWLAALGLGCIPCGTSLLIPLMALVFSSAASSLIGTVNTAVLLLALLLTLFAVYKVGKVTDQQRLIAESSQANQL